MGLKSEEGKHTTNTERIVHEIYRPVQLLVYMYCMFMTGGRTDTSSGLPTWVLKRSYKAVRPWLREGRVVHKRQSLAHPILELESGRLGRLSGRSANTISFIIQAMAAPTNSKRNRAVAILNQQQAAPATLGTPVPVYPCTCSQPSAPLLPCPANVSHSLPQVPRDQRELVYPRQYSSASGRY